MKDAVLIPEPPLEPRPSARKPTAIGGMTHEEINKEIQKGWDSMEAGNVIPAKEVKERLRRKYGVNEA